MFVIQNKVFCFSFPRLALDIGDWVGEVIEADINPFVFFAEHDEHDIGNFQLTEAGFSALFADVEVMDVQVVEVGLGVGLEEVLFVVKTEGEALKALIK